MHFAISSFLFAHVYALRPLARRTCCTKVSCVAKDVATCATDSIAVADVYFHATMDMKLEQEIKVRMLCVCFLGLTIT